MKKLSIIILSCVALTPVFVNAAPANKPLSRWTCEDFLVLDTTYQPTAVGVSIALNMKNKGMENEIIDTKGIEKVTPIMVQECKKDKKQSFRQRLAKEWAKIK
ncbi:MULTISPECIES: acid-activated periplasmic chaperone HdeA [unclassified Acinetobacter]|uniref:acid-activated periplasmic chaperone HdeA n=1 Tax=unclassified Acinetobacter TaxID=196816 RepID=UPI001C225070|nr:MULTISPECIES: acid-activated periplasmic chaperone HdeA [unclassified Acinetobacter]